MKSAPSLGPFIGLPRLVALALLLLISTLPPAAVLTLGWQGLEQTLATEVEAQSTIATRTIGRNPGIWMLTPERLEFALRDLHQPERRLTLTDKNTTVLVRFGDIPPWPTLTLAREVYEFDDAVGRLELAGSLRPVLVKTAATGVLTLLLALAVTVPLYQRVLRTMRLAALRLDESEKRYRLLFEQARDGIVLIDPATQSFVDFNSTACAQLGYSREEFATLSIADIVLAETPTGITQCMALLHQQGWADFEARQQRKDRSDLPVHIIVQAIELNGKPLLHATFRDISERKRIELEIQDLNTHLEQRVEERTAELREAEEALKRLNETLARQVRDQVAELRQKDHLLIQQTRLAAMGEMMHNIAHQWRQPLNALGLILQNLTMDFNDGLLGKEDMKTQSAKAMRLIHGMSQTIDDFRDFFRPDNQACEFEIAQAVMNALAITGATLTSHHIALDLSLQPGLTVTGHINQFAQAVLNLVANAKDALIERGIRDGRISVRLEERDGKALLTIEDNAGGIAEELLPKIFDPYFTTKVQGSGIGLYMAKTIVERNLDGNLAATNAGSGARFVIAIPL